MPQRGVAIAPGVSQLDVMRFRTLELLHSSPIGVVRFSGTDGLGIAYVSIAAVHYRNIVKFRFTIATR